VVVWGAKIYLSQNILFSIYLEICFEKYIDCNYTPYIILIVIISKGQKSIKSTIYFSNQIPQYMENTFCNRA
jgi:hypothetical protein